MDKVFLFLCFGLTSIFINAQEINGTWYGLLEVQGVQLNLTFHFDDTAGTGLVATMDSPDQGATGIPVTTASFENSQLKLSVPAAGITYEGNYDDTKIITGIFKQGGLSLPLNLSRRKPEKAEILRPQEPQAPFPYISEEVSFLNREADITLAGTLTIPEGNGTFPAVILISGSGAQDRNSEILHHKPFLVLSDHFTRKGIAVLRFDERGVGKSEGVFSGATSYDFAKDVEAAIKFLSSRKEIDKNKIGLLGHSEGGLIAPIVAEESDSLAYIVMVAGPGLRGKELLLLQKREFERRSGLSAEEIAKGQALLEGAYDIMITSTEEGTALKEELRKTILENTADETKAEEIEMLLSQLSDPWFINMIKHDPAKYLGKVRIPILALYGEKDFQVPPNENAEAVRAALEEAGNKNYTIMKLENLNHLFQESTTGLLEEYAQIEQTFSPAAMEIISQWILEKTE